MVYSMRLSWYGMVLHGTNVLIIGGYLLYVLVSMRWDISRHNVVDPHINSYLSKIYGKGRVLYKNV
jgi:hypothetical protein